MSRGGLGARVDALTGGPGRRQRQMLRKLEELDRLDLHAGHPEEVLWPGGRSSQHDPRAWQPRHASGPRSAGHWWERHPSAGLLVVGLLVAGWFATPHVPGWIDRMMPARPALAASEARPPSDTSATHRLDPAVVGVPAAGAFSFMAMQDDRSGPVTFDPCRPVHYVVRGAPAAGPAARAVVTSAVAEVSAATGLRFVDDGDTDEAPSSGRALFQPDRYGKRWAPVLVAWSDPTEEPGLAGDTAGLGGGRPLRDTHGHLTYVSGTVWLDTPALAADLSSGSGQGRVRAVVMHELAHVVGAGHVKDPREIMAESNSRQTEFGPGDRYALSLLGSGECVPGL